MTVPGGCRTAERGQALAEYALIAWLVIAALLFATHVRVAPAGSDGRTMTVVEALFWGIQVQRDSVDFLLSLPVP